MFILSSKHLATAVASVALAAAFTVAPTAMQIGSFDDAAYAKNGNGGGGGNGGGSKGKSSNSSKAKKKTVSKGGGKARSGNTVRTTKKQTASQETIAAEAETEVEETEEGVELAVLTPDQKGRWNAINANQRARDVHIRNQKFNGTVGMLSYYQLAGKAASGAELNDYEQAALDSLIGDTTPVITDGELEDILNDPDDASAPVYEVTDGVSSCIENCDGAPDGNDAIANYTEERKQEAEETAVQDLFADAEQTIIGNSNKSTDGIENQLLDELAFDLGFSREDIVVDP